jgi:lysophospholipase L1-like esterase
MKIGPTGALAALSLALACAPATAQTGSLECTPAAIRIATTGIPPQNLKGMQVYEALEHSQLTTPLPRAAVLGDSLAAGWNVALLAEVLGSRVTNLGVPGDRTQNVLWRIQRHKEQLAELETVIVIVGTNNLGAGEAPCAVAAGLVAILKALRGAAPQARVLVLDVPPRGIDRKSFSAERAELTTLLRMLPGMVLLET